MSLSSRKHRPDSNFRAGKWITCNDEVIEKPDKKKKMRFDPDEPDQYVSSDQAYMLVYRLEKDIEPIQPSEAILSKVDEDNARLDTEMDNRKLQ